MNNLLEIMDKESCSKSEVYLYEEEGRWYAYHRSAKSLSKLSEAALKLKEDENYNHGRLVSLVLGRVSVALFFITSVVISYFKLNWGISVIIAIAVVALILILREDLTQYSRYS